VCGCGVLWWLLLTLPLLSLPPERRMSRDLDTLANVSRLRRLLDLLLLLLLLPLQRVCVGCSY
jgi:hypothetical protein